MYEFEVECEHEFCVEIQEGCLGMTNAPLVPIDAGASGTQKDSKRLNFGWVFFLSEMEVECEHEFCIEIQERCLGIANAPHCPDRRRSIGNIERFIKAQLWLG